MSTQVVAPFVHATRINQSLTASVEKRILIALSERAPRWLNSDHLTAIGLASQIGAGLCYVFAWNHRALLALAILFIVFNWLGDSLDGTLARVRQQQRPRYGFYVDHIVDIYGAFALMGGLALSGFAHPPIAIGMLVAFLILSAESYLATYTLGHFKMSQGLFGPTEIRILLCIGNLALMRNPYATLAGHRVLLFDLGGAIAIACMFLMAIATTVRHTAQLYRQEPLQRCEDPEPAA